MAAEGFPESGDVALPPAPATITSLPGAAGLSGDPPRASLASMCQASALTGRAKPNFSNNPRLTALLASAEFISNARPTSCLLRPGGAALGDPYFLNNSACSFESL